MMTRKGLNGLALIRAALAILTLGFLTSVPTYAQVAGATLSGTVTDPSGAGIPAAQLSIKNTATAVTRDITTDSAGFYSAPNLPPGDYDVTTSAKGFTTQVATGINLAVGAQQTLNIPLQVGQVTQQVQVTGEAAAVQLANSTVSAQVNSTTVRELPLNGRDWTSLAVLQPGVIGVRTQLSTSGTVNRGNRGFGNQLSNSGHRPQENTYRINGINVNDYSNGSPGSVLGAQLGVDAIQEFSVLTANYTAEYGRTSGGVVNAVLKSGTNGFHGDAYWFLRDKSLDARNFFEADRAPFHRNQFGASAGGPIRKDKTFIFGDFEAIRQDKSLSSQSVVPSVNARNGLLASGQLPPNPADPNGTNPNGIDNVIAKYLPLFPLPNTSAVLKGGDAGLFRSAVLQHYTENYVTSRVDHTISSQDSLTGLFFFDRSPEFTPDPFVLSTTETFSQRMMFGLEETHTFSATAVNSARIGYSRTNGLVGKPGAALQPIAADTSLGSPFLGVTRTAPIIQIQGGYTLEQGALGAQTRNNHYMNSYQVYDDAFLTRGTHSLKLGGSFERLQYNEIATQRPNGTWQFKNLSDFLQNKPKNLLAIGDVAFGRPLGNRISFFGIYLQDDWRFRPNLTVNIGLRYEPTTLPKEAHDQFNIVDFYGGTRTNVAHLYKTNPTLHNFEPRVGFSWDPTRNGKTAVRGGFGIFDVLPGPWYNNIQESGSYPFQFNVSGSLTHFPYTFPDVPFAGTTSDPALIAKNQGYAPDQNPKSNYAMNWNLNVQREITPTLTAMVGYIGSHTVHSPFTTDQSNYVQPVTPGSNYWPVPIGGGSIPNPNVGNLRPTFFAVSSRYEGAVAQLTKRMGHGVQAQGSFTWGKCLSGGDSGVIGDPFQNSFTSLLFFDRNARWGLCDFNVTQNFVANFIWQVPSPKSGSSLARHLLGGWQLGGIVSASTGTPTTVWISGDPLGLINNDAVPYPDRVAGCDPVNHNFKSDPSGVLAYINLNCFYAPVAPASIASDPTKCVPYTNAAVANTCQNLNGNAGRNTVIGPGLANVDFSVFKNNYIRSISETFNIQFRAEFFNIFNRATFLVPNFNDGNNEVMASDGSLEPAAAGGHTGGVIDSTGTNDPRQIQFSLKIIW
jgi:hypothetical protein